MDNVVILVSTLNKGGAERVAANMSLEFAKHYNVFLVVHDASDITYPYDGQLIDLQLPPAKGLAGKLITFFKRVIRVRNIKKNNNIKYSISHLPMCNYVNVFSRYHDKVITYVHTMEEPTAKKKVRERLVAALADTVVCVSECARLNMLNNFHIPERKLKTIYNFCDISVEKKSDNISAASCINIVNMGRFVKAKGQWHLIRAMKKVSARFPDTRLTIYGEGELRGNFENLISKLGLTDVIALPGFVLNPYNEIAKADIYANPAEREGLPMALIEAGNCGVAVVSTDCDSGCREVLAPSTPVSAKTSEVEEAQYGILVPVDYDNDMTRTELSDAESKMADAIIKLIEDRELAKYYADKAYERSLQFRAEHIMKCWDELLQ